MLIQEQRPVCLGSIISGQRPEVCNGCSLHQHAIEVTKAHTKVDELPESPRDLVNELQIVHDVAQDPRDGRRYIAQEMLTDVSNTIIAHMVEERKSLIGCPNYRRSLPTE